MIPTDSRGNAIVEATAQAVCFRWRWSGSPTPSSSRLHQERLAGFHGARVLVPRLALSLLTQNRFEASRKLIFHFGPSPHVGS